MFKGIIESEKLKETIELFLSLKFAFKPLD